MSGESRRAGRPMGTTRRRPALQDTLHRISAWAVAPLFLLPLVWMLSASLRQPGLPPPRGVEWIPNPIAWSNYAEPFRLLPFGTYALNSLLVTASAVALTLATASWAGLGLLLVPPRCRSVLVALSLVLLLIPPPALWLTRFVLFRELGLINNWGALLVPALGGSSPLFVLLFLWTFLRIPAALFEAARLDGAGALTLWSRISLPSARPTLTAVAVLSFLMYWSDFVSPLLYLKSQQLYTLPVGLHQLQQLDRTNWPILLAASVLLSAPAALSFLWAQRHFLQDSRLGGTGEW